MVWCSHLFKNFPQLSFQFCSPAKKKNDLRLSGVKKKGSFSHRAKLEIQSPNLGKGVLSSPSGAYFSERPPHCFSQPRPLLERAGLEGGARLGAGPHLLCRRRLDDRDKMANLPGAIKGLYPETLSPEQLEKLRGFKVGAVPTPASIGVQLLPGVRARPRREGTREPVPR